MSESYTPNTAQVRNAYSAHMGDCHGVTRDAQNEFDRWLAAYDAEATCKELDARPEVVCLCGSTRFREEFVEANRVLTLAGAIVLAPGVFGHSGDPITTSDKSALDELHFRKIDMADRVVIVAPGGYIGDSTKKEIAYARATGKPLAFWEEKK